MGDVQQMKIEDGHTYAFFVNATSDPKQSYSAFVFQAHAELSPVTLMNISRSCNVPRECHTFGLHVGMVQLLPFRSRVTYNFSVDFFCTNCSNISQELLVAVVGIPYDGEEQREREGQNPATKCCLTELTYVIVFLCH